MHSLGKGHLPFPPHVSRAIQRLLAIRVAIASALTGVAHAAAPYLRRFVLATDQWARHAMVASRQTTRQAAGRAAQEWYRLKFAAVNWFTNITRSSEDDFVINLGPADLMLIEQQGPMAGGPPSLPAFALESDAQPGPGSNGTSHAEDGIIAQAWGEAGPTSASFTPEVELLVRTSGREARSNVGAPGWQPSPSSRPSRPRFWGQD